MNRPLPPIQEPEVLAVAVFLPSGAALVDVGTAGSPDLSFTRQQALQLRTKLEEFERRCIFEDGRPDHRQRIHREAL